MRIPVALDSQISAAEMKPKASNTMMPKCGQPVSGSGVTERRPKLAANPNLQ